MYWTYSNLFKVGIEIDWGWKMFSIHLGSLSIGFLSLLNSKKGQSEEEKE